MRITDNQVKIVSSTTYWELKKIIGENEANKAAVYVEYADDHMLVGMPFGEYVFVMCDAINGLKRALERK